MICNKMKVIFDDLESLSIKSNLSFFNMSDQETIETLDLKKVFRYND